MDQPSPISGHTCYIVVVVITAAVDVVVPVLHSVTIARQFNPANDACISCVCFAWAISTVSCPPLSLSTFLSLPLSLSLSFLLYLSFLESISREEERERLRERERERERQRERGREEKVERERERERERGCFQER